MTIYVLSRDKLQAGQTVTARVLFSGIYSEIIGENTNCGMHCELTVDEAQVCIATMPLVY